MNDAVSEVPVIDRTEPTVQETEGGNITVIARYPYQMEKCQKSLIEWCAQKIAQTQAEADDLLENLEIAKKNGWGTAAFVRHSRKAIQRVQFYDKIKLALEAGHCIVPNFPVDIIAIRTKKHKPEEQEDKDRWDRKEQSADVLPSGEGEYKSPLPVIFQRALPTGKDGAAETYYFAKEFQDCDFPFTVAKPEILSATALAMMDKVFDEIGVLPGSKKRKADPIIVGRIIDPRSTYDKRFVTFLIAWFVDTSVL